jgi:hypothetical protein
LLCALKGQAGADSTPAKLQKIKEARGKNSHAILLKKKT